jgi:Helix-turn-helix.
MTDSKASALGEWIRAQRELQDLSMRQMATMAGISNPYLSQIERGLRAPSEQVLEAIATSLQTSADVLREDAGVKPPEEEGESAVVEAIKSDRHLSAAQRRAMLEVYEAFTA